MSQILHSYESFGWLRPLVDFAALNHQAKSAFKTIRCRPQGDIWVLFIYKSKISPVQAYMLVSESSI